MTRTIRINPVLNGFMVEVGCQLVVFESAKKMLDELGQYYAAPDAVEHRFLKNAVNDKNGPRVAPAPISDRQIATGYMAPPPVATEQSCTEPAPR
jgi:hypothetical protein